MKIAISASEPSLTGTVDVRFGRAPFFLLYDLQNDQSSFISNDQALDAVAGAGIQAARHVIEAGAEAVLTGHCGPKAFKALQAAEIRLYVNVQGSLMEAVQAFRDGQLQVAENANAEGHWI